MDTRGWAASVFKLYFGRVSLDVGCRGADLGVFRVVVRVGSRVVDRVVYCFADCVVVDWVTGCVVVLRVVVVLGVVVVVVVLGASVAAQKYLT